MRRGSRMRARPAALRRAAVRQERHSVSSSGAASSASATAILDRVGERVRLERELGRGSGDGVLVQLGVCGGERAGEELAALGVGRRRNLHAGCAGRRLAAGDEDDTLERRPFLRQRLVDDVGEPGERGLAVEQCRGARCLEPRGLEQERGPAESLGCGRRNRVKRGGGVAREREKRRSAGLHDRREQPARSRRPPSPGYGRHFWLYCPGGFLLASTPSQLCHLDQPADFVYVDQPGP